MQALKHQKDSLNVDHKISQSFRKQGIAEESKKTKAENLLPATKQVKEVLNLIGEKTENF